MSMTVSNNLWTTKYF